MRRWLEPERAWPLGAWTLAVLILLAYLPSWWAGYIWDDDLLVYSNRALGSWDGLLSFWTTRNADICPLTLTSFWFEHALWGNAALPYHLVTIVLHFGCALVFWQVLRELQVPGAWLGAALWAMHPVQVESVAWISETKNTQSGLFLLLAVLFFIRGLSPEKESRPHVGWVWLFALLAMTSKSSTVILPVVLGLCAWWVEGRWHWRHLRVLTPIFLLSLLMSLVSLWTQTELAAKTLHGERSWPERLAVAGDAIWFYAGKLVWPHPLMTLYPEWTIDTAAWTSYLPLAAAGLGAGVLWLGRRGWARLAYFVVALFLLALLPVLGFANTTWFQYSPVSDHFLYLPSLAPLALAGAGLNLLTARWQPMLLRWGPPAALLLTFGALSWQRGWVYMNQETLWVDNIAKNPRCWLGYNNLGNIYFLHGEVQQSMDYYLKSLEINPNYDDAHNNLGALYLSQHQVAPAIREFLRAVEINPNDFNAYFNLANLYLKEGRPQESIEPYLRDIQLDPTNAEARSNLGVAYANLGRIDEAIAQYRAALTIRPDAFAHNNLGNALLNQGKIEESIDEFRQALALSPGYALGHNNLARAQERKGLITEAIAEYKKALALDPNLAQAKDNLLRLQTPSSSISVPK